MKFLVIGCGSIGQRHIKNLLNLGVEVHAYDIDPLKLEKLTYAPLIDNGRFLHQAFSDIPKDMDAWVICTPPASHIIYAYLGLAHGAHVFVEKPLSDTLEGVDATLQLARYLDRVVYVGYNMRWYPEVQKMKDYLDTMQFTMRFKPRIFADFAYALSRWQPGRKPEELYASKELILDCSHEIDYIIWMLGMPSEIKCNLSRTRAYIKLGFSGTLESGIWLDVGEKRTKYTRWASTLNGTTFAFSGMQGYNQMYVDEMKHFIECCKGNEKPLVTGEDGKRVLEICLACKESAKTGKAVEL